MSDNGFTYKSIASSYVLLHLCIQLKIIGMRCYGLRPKNIVGTRIHGITSCGTLAMSYIFLAVEHIVFKTGTMGLWPPWLLWGTQL